MARGSSAWSRGRPGKSSSPTFLDSSGIDRRRSLVLDDPRRKRRTILQRRRFHCADDAAAANGGAGKRTRQIRRNGEQQLDGRPHLHQPIGAHQHAALADVLGASVKPRFFALRAIEDGNRDDIPTRARSVWAAGHWSTYKDSTRWRQPRTAKSGRGRRRHWRVVTPRSWLAVSTRRASVDVIFSVR